VGLVDCGIERDLIKNLNNRLNKLGHVKKAFEFEVIGEINVDNIDSNDVPKHHYYSAPAILEVLRSFVINNDKNMPLVFGLTSVPLAHQEKCPDWEYDYFGVWPPQIVEPPLEGSPIIGVASTYLWVRRYETLAYRTTEQFIEHLVVAFLGDVLYHGSLTHARFRHCVFDYNEDLDSIVDSVRRADLCEQCKEHLKNEQKLGPLGASIGGGRIVEAMEGILNDVRTPRWKMVFQALQQDGTFSILILGVLGAIGVNILSNWIESFSWGSVALVLFIGVLVGWGISKYFRPPLRG
jgi:predicted Zn-dependent protease